VKLAHAHTILYLIFYQINKDGEIQTRDRLVIKTLIPYQRTISLMTIFSFSPFISLFYPDKYIMILIVIFFKFRSFSFDWCFLVIFFFCWSFIFFQFNFWFLICIYKVFQFGPSTFNFLFFFFFLLLRFLYLSILSFKSSLWFLFFQC